MSNAPAYVNNTGIFRFQDPLKDAPSLTFTAGGEAMLVIAPDGFSVRGVKVEQDEQEARRVYDAMCAWLRHQGWMRDL